MGESGGLGNGSKQVIYSMVKGRVVLSVVAPTLSCFFLKK